MHPHTFIGSRQPGQCKCPWCGQPVRSATDCLSPLEKLELAIRWNEHGRTYKSVIRDEWERGLCNGTLQSIRNKIGPSGLVRLKTSVVKRYAQHTGVTK